MSVIICIDVFTHWVVNRIRNKTTLDR